MQQWLGYGDYNDGRVDDYHGYADYNDDSCADYYDDSTNDSSTHHNTATGYDGSANDYHVAAGGQFRRPWLGG